MIPLPLALTVRVPSSESLLVIVIVALWLPDEPGSNVTVTVCVWPPDIITESGLTEKIALSLLILSFGSLISTRQPKICTEGI